MKRYNNSILLYGIFLLVTCLLTISVVVVKSEPNYPHCESCISFLDNEIFEIERIIAIIGYNTTCNKICSKLSGNSTVIENCNYLCGVIGVQQFIQITTEYEGSNSFEINTMYMCEQIKVCPVYSDKAVITSGTVVPESGPLGTNFTLIAYYKVELFHHLGLSTMEAVILCGSEFPYGYQFSHTIVYEGSGEHEVTFNFQTTTNTTYYAVCDYGVQFTLCENGCGMDKSKVLSMYWLTFNITK